jgi:DNA-binding GntR family transcriptional regulator
MPIHRKPLKDEVFDVLHQDILAGQYAAGTWLRQEEVAARLGVSMTPVREALDLLVSSGLAERVPYRGVRVLRPSARDILDSYAMRLLLEGLAARAAATRITGGQLAKLRSLLTEASRLLEFEDMSQERASSRALHAAIVEASGNALLYRLYLNVLNTFPDWLLYEHLFRRPELLASSMQEEHREHQRIVDAIGRHDPDAAVKAAIEHVLGRGRELQIYLGVPLAELGAREAEILGLLAPTREPITTTERELS